MSAIPVAFAQGSKQVVEAKVVLEADGAAPGASLKAAALAKVAPGFHVNDHKPSEEYLIPTEWTIEAIKEISVTKMVYPKGELKKFTFSDDPLSVYEGDLTIGARLKIARAAKPGVYKLKGVFKYQACNDHACLPPKSFPLGLDVEVLAQGQSAKRVNAEVFRNVRFD
jgi:thiol:disulfide interchange protein DsbD